MSPRQNLQRIARIPFHVVLWASFPILALWNQNSLDIPAGVALEVLWPVGLVAAAAALIVALPIRSLRRGALAAVVVLVPSLLYGYVFTRADNSLGLVVWGLLIAAGLLAITRVTGETLVQLTVALNGVSLVLVLLNGVPAILGARDRQSALADRGSIELDLEPGQDLPNIWYLVPDRFGRSDTLADTYGIDNADFVRGLRDLGFQVFDQAATNYPQSLTSITAALNLGYLEDSADHELQRVETAWDSPYVEVTDLVFAEPSQ